MMELLFKRQQSQGVRRVTFKLWGKVELDEAEQALVKRYRFDEALLIDALQPNLLRNSAILGAIAGLIAFAILDLALPTGIAIVGGLIVAAGLTYWRYHNNRETLFVRDLLHGRYFTCNSVIELARKEAWLTTLVSFLRQVMESAKHWDGTEQHSIEPLPKEEARAFILKGV